jgi:hypothetical protein
MGVNVGRIDMRNGDHWTPAPMVMLYDNIEAREAFAAQVQKVADTYGEEVLRHRRFQLEFVEHRSDEILARMKADVAARMDPLGGSDAPSWDAVKAALVEMGESL